MIVFAWICSETKVCKDCNSFLHDRTDMKKYATLSFLNKMVHGRSWPWRAVG